MKAQKVIDHIVSWLDEYCAKAGMNGFIIGISGGIDSAITSTLCAKTGKKVLLISMPIHQKDDQLARANEHAIWLKANFENAAFVETNLTHSFDAIVNDLPESTRLHLLSMANTRARLRMLTLYAVGQSNGLLVAGTGNKIEDFGVGFFTKYGDGGVDLSPIADLTKSQVFALAKEMNIVQSILTAKPTDGLWDTERSDEEQLGATYPELEWAMEFIGASGLIDLSADEFLEKNAVQLTPHQTEVIRIYLKFHYTNKHKMDPIPVCLIPKEFK